MPRSVASTRAWGLISWAAKMPRTGAQQRVAVEQLEVAGQLLDAVDLAAALDLDRDAGARRRRGTSGRPARSRWGTPGGPGSARRPACRGARRAAPGGASRRRPSAGRGRCRARGRSRGGPPRSGCAGCRRSCSETVHSTCPSSVVPSRRVHGRRHPVQRLVGAAVGVDQHRAVGLDHQHPRRHREVGGQPSGVVDLAPGNDESHGAGIYLTVVLVSSLGHVVGRR